MKRTNTKHTNMKKSYLLTKSEKQTLTAKAIEASEKAYAPYSKFHVGSAILTKNGHYFCGCNVENASYGLTICAERNAVFSAVQTEGKSMKIKAIAVAVLKNKSAAPCGACRQVIAEFSNYELGNETVILFMQKEKWISKKISELLPDSFRFRK